MLGKCWGMEPECLDSTAEKMCTKVSKFIKEINKPGYTPYTIRAQQMMHLTGHQEFMSAQKTKQI